VGDGISCIISDDNKRGKIGMPFTIQLIGIIVIVVSCLFLYILPNWRILISTLAAIYLVQFVFIFYLSTPLLGVVNLIIGWMACAVIGLSIIRMGISENLEQYQSGIAFHLISGFFFILTAFAISISAYSWLTKIPYLVFAAGLSLMFTGLLQLINFQSVMRIVISLLVFLSGFELIYFSLEISLLVVILVGFVKLGLSFMGTYLVFVNRLDGKI
jgi:hypothetical protein